MTSVDAAPRLLSDINFDQCLCGLERYDMRITRVISGLDYSPSDMQVTSWRNEMARAGWRRPSKRPRCGVGLARVVKSLNPLAFHNGKAQNSDWSAGNEGFPFRRNPYRVVLKLVRFVRRVHRGIRKHLPERTASEGSGFSEAKRRSFGGDLGCRGKGRQPLYPLHSFVEARLSVSYRPRRRLAGFASCAWIRRAARCDERCAPGGRGCRRRWWDRRSARASARPAVGK
jgi:hypothetical protein